MGDDGGAAARSQGAGSRRQVEREDGGGRGGNACEHQESTRTTPTLYSTCTVAVHGPFASGMHVQAPHDTPGARRVVAAVLAARTRGGFTHGGTAGAPRPASCWRRARTCTVRRTDMRLRRNFFFADSQGHVRTGQRAARAAGRGGWVCERSQETLFKRFFRAKTLLIKKGFRP